MEYRSSEYKAGLFIFISVIALMILVFFLGDVKERFQPKKGIHIVFNFTGGLDIGAPVRYAGLHVGRVTNIDLLNSFNEKETDQVTVLAEISPSINLKRDSIATIKTAGLMGGPYIDIRPGTPESPSLGKGEQILGQDAFQFNEVGDMMEEVVLQVRRFTQLAEALSVDTRETLLVLQSSLKSVNSILVDNREEIRENLLNLVDISRELSDILGDKGDRISKTIEHISAVAEKADRLMASKEKSLAKIVDQTEELTHELDLLLKENRKGVTQLVKTMEEDTREITKNISSATGNLDQTMQQSNAILVENRRNLLELLRNLNETSRNLKVVSEDLKLNPWKLVRKSDEKSPTVKKEWTSSSSPKEIRMQRLDKLSKN